MTGSGVGEEEADVDLMANEVGGARLLKNARHENKGFGNDVTKFGDNETELNWKEGSQRYDSTSHRKSVVGHGEYGREEGCVEEKVEEKPTQETAGNEGDNSGAGGWKAIASKKHTTSRSAFGLARSSTTGSLAQHVRVGQSTSKMSSSLAHEENSCSKESLHEQPRLPVEVMGPVKPRRKKGPAPTEYKKTPWTTKAFSQNHRSSSGSVLLSDRTAVLGRWEDGQKQASNEEQRPVVSGKDGQQTAIENVQ